MRPKVSIIVPVYNCEEYLDEAIESLLKQTLKEIEVIIVNDGSTDNSLSIANKYKNLDERVKIISQVNQGVSVARNMGIEATQGEYIGFIDGDDWIEFDMYKTLYDVAIKNNLDLVISDFEQELEGKKIINKLDITANSIVNKECIINSILPQFLQHEKLNTVCNKLFKRELIQRFNIRFPKGVALGEDGFFNINYFSNVKSLMYIDYCGYHYREVEGSATRNIFEKDYFNRALEVYNEEIPLIYYRYFNYEYLKELKAIKFISSVISYTHIYFKPQTSIAFKERYKYIKKMISNESVNTVIKRYWDILYSDKSRYERLLIQLIKSKLTLGIYILTSYSRLRCREGWRNRDENYDVWP